MSNSVHGDAGSSDTANNGTSKTRFGMSVESQAQIADAAATATATDKNEVLNVYRLSPVAALDDPIWNGAAPKGEVIVAARTSGDARIVAAGLELDFTDRPTAPADDVTTRFASLFRNEKAYTVVEIAHGEPGLKRGRVPLR